MKYLVPFLLVPLMSFSQNKGASPIVQSRESRVKSQNTYAVVVGISDYQDPAIPDLRFADKDAEAFANYLRSNAGGRLDNDHLKVLINKNATAAQFAVALDWLMEVVKENDQVILYFSGHGDVEKKTITQPGYLLCWDAPSRVYLAGGTMALPMFQDVITTLSLQNKAKVIVITDACRSGYLAGSSVGGSQITGANLARQYANEIKILSCQPNEYSIEGEQWGGGRGAFSYNLLNALYGLADQNNDSIVSLQEVIRYLEDHVSSEVAPVSQIPMVVGNRAESLSTVDSKLLSDIRSGQYSQSKTISILDTRGFEEALLEQMDTSILEIYLKFKNALKEKKFLTPHSDCAEFYYRKLLSESKLIRLHSTLRRNYAATLQDEAQQLLNDWIMSSKDRTEAIATANNWNRIPQKTFTEKIKTFPLLLERSMELLGKNHYMYNPLLSRKFFFEGYILANENRNPNNKNIKKAITSFKNALSLEPELSQAYWQLSLVFGYNLLELDSAVYYAQKSIEMNPQWAMPYITLSQLISSRFNKFELAKIYLDMAFKVDSNFVWNDYGNYWFGIKNYVLAEKYYLKSIQYDTINIIALNNLGTLYAVIKQNNAAEKYLKKAIELDSTFVLAHNNLGTYYMENGEMDEAEKYFKISIHLDPSNAISFNKLASVYVNKKQLQKAEWYFKKAIELDSTFALAYNNLGTIYLDKAEFNEAERYFKISVYLDSTNAMTFNKLASVYVNKKQLQKAEWYFVKAIELDSTFVLAYNNLGALKMETMNYFESEKYFYKAVQLDSTFNLAYYNLACQYSLQNRLGEAFNNLETALQHGYINYDWMLKDKDIALLRKQKEWNELMKKYFPDRVSK